MSDFWKDFIEGAVLGVCFMVIYLFIMHYLGV